MQPLRQSKRQRRAPAKFEDDSEPQQPETKRPRIEVQKRNDDAVLLEHFEKLLSYKNALYHPQTKQKLFVVNTGKCLKKDCIVARTLHKAKVLMPQSGLQDFRGDLDPKCIGIATVCFSHYGFEAQKHYLVHGEFPTGAKMLQHGDNLLQNKKNVRNTVRFSKAAARDSAWVISMFIFLLL